MPATDDTVTIFPDFWRFMYGATAMQVYSTSRNELPWLATDLTQGSVGVWSGDDGNR